MSTRNRELKKQDRIQAKNRLKDTTEQYRNDASLCIADRLFNLEQFKKSKSIFIYMSFGNEVQTKHIIERCFFEGKHVCVPRLVGDEMQCIEITPTTAMVVNEFGITEPTLGSEILPELAVIPLLAFDRDLNRLGRGKGYYDRMLSKIDCFSVAIAFSVQEAYNLTTDIFDRKPNVVITEKEIII